MIFRLISPRIHGIVDYLVAVLLVLAPQLFGFAHVSNAATLCYVIAGVHLAMSLLTDYPLGAIKKIPFPVHGFIELAAAFALLAIPSIFGFNNEIHSRNFFMISGVALLGIVALTRYDEAVSPGEHKLTDGRPLTTV